MASETGRLADYSTSAPREATPGRPSTNVEVTYAPWFWPALVSITLAGIVVRILFVIFARFQRVANDAQFFRTTAHNLISGNGYSYPFPTNPAKAVPTAAHPPLFSLVLSSFDLLGMESVRTQRLALSVVASVAIVLIGLVGRRVFCPMVGVVAAAIAALHPLWLQTVGSLMSESVYLIAILLVLLSALRALDRPTGWRFVALGGAVALATLVRSEAIILLVLLGGLVVLFAVDDWKLRLRVAAALLAGCAAVLAPWVLRNEVQLGSAAISTQEGLTLAGSYCPSTFNPHSETFGSWDGGCAIAAAFFSLRYARPPGGLHQWDEVALDQALTHGSEDFARTHLSELPRVVMAREVSTWFLTGRGYQQSLAVWGGRNATFEQVGGVVFWILAFLGVIGAVVMGQRSSARLLVLLVPIAAVVINVALTYGDTRFRTMAEPSIALLASIGAVYAAQKVRERFHPLALD